jgi:hypothetical protein
MGAAVHARRPGGLSHGASQWRAEAAAGDYEVGYGKPPKHTRWEKGFCPNPKGRGKKPKKKDTVAEILDRHLEAKVTLRDGADRQQVSRFEYLIMKAIDNAGKT